MTTPLTIVGGGVGGLVAAVSAREAGFEVTLHEAHQELGGRARTSPGPYRANWGGHVLYADGPFWGWLARRGLLPAAHRPPAVPRLAFRLEGELHTVPPVRYLRALHRLSHLDAPIEASFGQWAAEALDDEDAARRVSNLLGVATFDHDPGRLSAAFVNSILRRATALPPKVRYLEGGWGTLVDRLATHARRMGVRIETKSHVDRLPPPPVILAVPLARAAALLGDPSLRGNGTRTALLDLGMTRRGRDPFILSDLDASGWVEVFSKPDPTLAPAGEQLLQCQAGILPGEGLDQAVTRIEALLDLGYPGWRDRETWRRRMAVEDESGALDLPGSSWRDRPRAARGGGVQVVGDMVDAPGLLSEVSFTSAVDAVARLGRERPRVRAA
jgi:phytoene dehydrogenase-like protein